MKGFRDEILNSIDSIKSDIGKNVEHSEAGFRLAAEKCGKIAKITEFVSSIFSSEDSSSSEELFEEEEDEYDAIHTKKFLGKTKDKKRKRKPVVPYIRETSNYDDDDDDYDDCKDEYDEDRIMEIIRDLEIVKGPDGDMEEFRENTVYGKYLFKGKLDQIALQTGQQPNLSVDVLFSIDPREMVIENCKMRSTICFLCNMKHECRFRVKFDNQMFPVGANCVTVVRAIRKFTYTLRYVFEDDDDETYIKDIEKDQLELLSVHQQKNKKR